MRIGELKNEIRSLSHKLDLDEDINTMYHIADTKVEMYVIHVWYGRMIDANHIGTYYFQTGNCDPQYTVAIGKTIIKFVKKKLGEFTQVEVDGEIGI